MATEKEIIKIEIENKFDETLPDAFVDALINKDTEELKKVDSAAEKEMKKVKGLHEMKIWWQLTLIRYMTKQAIKKLNK